MNHRFKNICHCPVSLLTGVDTLSKFMRKVEKLSLDEEWALAGWSPEDFKGDALEAFVEVLVNASPIDKRINIVDYRPHCFDLDGADMGIDGYGVSHNGNLHTVQVKYRSNVEHQLNASNDHISNFVAKTTSSPVYRDADMTLFKVNRFDN